jgi:hypothetical protein
VLASNSRYPTDGISPPALTLVLTFIGFSPFQRVGPH